MKIFNSQALARFTAIAFFLILTMWNTLSAHAVSLAVTPSTLNVAEGQTFSVDIFISGVSDLYGFQFDVGYDPSILSVNTVSEGTFLPLGGPTLWLPGLIDNFGGTIDDTADSLQSAISGVSGNGVLANISFTALATGSSDINIFDVILLNSLIADIGVDSIQSANIIVSVDPTIPEPATATLLAIGLIGLAFAHRQRLSKA